MKNRIVFLLALLFGTFPVNGQDTIRVMYYNLLNFPGESPDRVVELRQIVGYAQPDVLVVCELQSEEGADLILNEALNVFGADNYTAAEYVNGPTTDNMLFYNSDLLGLESQEEIPTDLRDINEYRLYYKSPGLNADSDTVYLNFYGAHLKAGSGFFNQRKEEALTLKFRLNSISNTENVFVGGDFNFYSGNESGCLALRESGDVDLFDPIESIGDWSGNFTYASIHTQSTRTSPLSDGAGGGMDDRFDMIFTTADIFDNSNGIEFISGSYEALGQDGDRFNETIHVPFNPIVPDSIANALYFMSDHLPVIMDVKTDYTANIETPAESDKLYGYFNPITNQITFNSTLVDGLFTLVDLSGKVLVKQVVNQVNEIKIPEHLPNGIYFWNLTTAQNRTSSRFIIQH